MVIDHINGCIGFIGSVFVARSIFQLWRHKQIRGIYWPVALFISTVGSWNVYLFYTLDLFYSYVMAVPYALLNLIWLVMAFYYRRN